MHLSRLILDPRSREVRRDLADCQEMHRTLLRAFPAIPGGPCSARRESGLLYRLDQHRTTGEQVICAQSILAPDWSQLPTGYLRSAEGNPATKSVDHQYEALTDDMVLAFTLLASPTRKTVGSLKSERLAGLPKRNGKRRALFSDEERLAWLMRKAISSGFELLTDPAEPALPELLIAERGLIRGRRQRPTGSDSSGVSGPDEARASDVVVFTGVLYQGCLRITDRSRFLRALRDGIGPGRAYGLGLLSIAPTGWRYHA